MITECRICSSEKIELVLSLGKFALSDFVAKASRFKVKKYPLDLVRCAKCSLVQLGYTVSQNYLYTNHYGYYSGINQTMRTHLKDLANKAMRKIELKKGCIIVDIGANDSTLLKQFKLKGITKVGFDPVKKFSKEYNKPGEVFINNYFNAGDFHKLFADKKALLITAISMFYDINDPNSFIKDVVSCLDSNGILIIQQNYLGSMLKQNAFDNIVHEHLEYYSLYTLENLLAAFGLEVFDVDVNDLNGGSFRVYVAFKGKRRVSKRVITMRNEEKLLKIATKQPFVKFAKRLEKIRHKLMNFIQSEAKENKKIYLYGASTRGNTTIQYFRLNKKLIQAAVERNPVKWGKMIASVKIPIISEQAARQQMPDYMLVLPWYFKKEILKRERDYLKKGGKLIFPLPEFKIYTYPK